MTVDTMEAGKYAGVEVSAAHTIEDCWDMVNAFEESGSHCMILENVCSRRDIMAIHKHGDAGYVWRVDPCPLWLPA